MVHQILKQKTKSPSIRNPPLYSSPERRCGKLVQDGRVALLVVSLVVALAQQVELVQVDCVPAQHPGQELVPGDVLLHRGHDPTGLLVEGLVGPLGVQTAQITGDAVVLPGRKKVTQPCY